MFQSINFCGVSGQSYKFEAIKLRDNAWTSQAGIILFTTADGRVVKLDEQFGKVEDITAIWRWREAQRFGATHMYIRHQKDRGVRLAEIDDLRAGLNPVCDAPSDAYETASESARVVMPLAA
ncbi:hypothetical protein [Hirschia maritima]|uniref:hypothetical protein n=1 Tax=Hirschia maritima TaxID=1121961 RepID=UPI0003A4FB23|nr:hypothetical protein [Hirschia maritima]